MPDCCRCGNDIPEEDLIRFEKEPVCPSCKPLYVQELSEGVNPLPKNSRSIWSYVGIVFVVTTRSLSYSVPLVIFAGAGFVAGMVMLSILGIPWLISRIRSTSLLKLHSKRKSLAEAIYRGLGVVFYLSALSTYSGRYLRAIGCFTFFDTYLVVPTLVFVILSPIYVFAYDLRLALTGVFGLGKSPDIQAGEGHENS